MVLRPETVIYDKHTTYIPKGLVVNSVVRRKPVVKPLKTSKPGKKSRLILSVLVGLLLMVSWLWGKR